MSLYESINNYLEMYESDNSFSNWYLDTQDDPYIIANVNYEGDDLQVIIPLLYDTKKEHYIIDKGSIWFMGDDGDEVYPDIFDCDNIIRNIPKTIIDKINELKYE